MNSPPQDGQLKSLAVLPVAGSQTVPAGRAEGCVPGREEATFPRGHETRTIFPQ